MKITILFTFLFFMAQSLSFGQDFSGQLSGMPEQSIILKSFESTTNYVIDSTTTDAEGNFSLEFNKKDYGMGFLEAKNQKPFIVVLADEDIDLKGKSLTENNTVSYSKGKQNQAYMQYAKEQPKREQALNAWVYLQKMYTEDTLFSEQRIPAEAILAEVNRIENEEKEFLSSLPKESFVKWFLPIRKLVSSVSVVAQYRTEDIPATREALRAIDYSDDRLYKSGLFKEALDNHVWFIENSSGSLDLVFEDLNTSIDNMFEDLIMDEAKFNEVTDYLFNLLEKRSLFTSAEYLALKVLNEQSCTLNENVAKQLEGYRKMKKGNQVPNISFGEATYYPSHTKAKSLYDIDSDYTLVVFAAGWCGHCTKEIPKLAKKYPAWHEKGLEVAMVGLDESPKDFAQFAAPFPFISTTDYQKWESQVVKDFHVYATPTMFLLDKDKNILLRPKSTEHLEAWVNSYMK